MSSKTLWDVLSNEKIVIPLIILLTGGTVYGNSETVRNWVHGKKPVPTVEDITSVGSFEDQVRASLESIAAKFKEQDRRIVDLEKRDVTDQAEIREELNQLNAWHE